MPLYEYKCADCGAVFDTFRSFKEADDPIPCKTCRGVHTRRLLSRVYASVDGRAVSGSSSGGCSGCSGGSCAGCGGH